MSNRPFCKASFGCLQASFAHYKDVRAQVHANRGEADGMVHSTAELNTMCKLDGTRNVNVAVLVSLQVHLSLRMPPRPG